MRHVGSFLAVLLLACLHCGPAYAADTRITTKKECSTPRCRHRLIVEELRQKLASIEEMLAAVDPEDGKAMGAFRMVTDYPNTDPINAAQLAAASNERRFASDVLAEMSRKVDNAQEECVAARIKSCWAWRHGYAPEESSEKPHNRSIQEHLTDLREAVATTRQRIERRIELADARVRAYWSRRHLTKEHRPRFPADPAVRHVKSGASGSCDQALSHAVALAIQATGSGPSNGERGEFLRRCGMAQSPRIVDCVLRLEQLPRGPNSMDPVSRCLQLSPASTRAY